MEQDIDLECSVVDAVLERIPSLSELITVYLLGKHIRKLNRSKIDEITISNV